MQHKFSTKDAEDYGIEKAILLEHLRFHQSANEGNDELTFDGEAYSFLKPSTIKNMYPYLSYSSVRRWLKELEQDDVIKSFKPKKSMGNHLKFYRVIDKKVPNDQADQSNDKAAQTDQSNDQNDQSNDQTDQSKNDQNDHSSILPSEEPSEPITNRYVKLLDYWNNVNDCSLRMTDKKRGQIKTRLKTYTEDELRQSILIRSNDKWMNGEGKQFKSNWDSFWRNDEKAERYLNMKDQQQKNNEYETGSVEHLNSVSDRLDKLEEY